MFIKDIVFMVRKSKYSDRHFAKDFLKKYGEKKWNLTLNTIFEVLKRSFAFSTNDKIKMMNFSSKNNTGIFKLKFAIAGENQSPKSSGNRVVFSLDNEKGIIVILLMYSETHCPKNQTETAWIENQIKNSFLASKKI